MTSIISDYTKQIQKFLNPILESDEINSDSIKDRLKQLTESINSLIETAQNVIENGENIELDELNNISELLDMKFNSLSQVFANDSLEAFSFVKLKTLIADIIQSVTDARSSQQSEPPPEPDKSSATIEVIQTNLNNLTEQLNFSLSRLTNGNNDDLAKRPILDAIDISIPKLVDDITQFINKNYDENDELIETNHNLRNAIFQLTDSVTQLKNEKKLNEKELISVREELNSLGNLFKKEKLKKQAALDELKTYQLQNPAEFRERNAKLKSENVAYRAEVKGLMREVSVLKDANKHITSEYTKLEVKYELAHQSQCSILDEMEAVSGFAGMGKYGYAINLEKGEWAYIHVFFTPKSLFLLRKDIEKVHRPIGERVVENLTMHIMFRTNSGLSLELDVSEWGGVTYPYHKVFKSMIGDNVISDCQQNYDPVIKKHNPKFAQRTAYFRSIDIKDIEGITEPLYILAHNARLENVSDIGSTGAERMVNELGFKKKDAQQLMQLIMPYMHEWNEEHGEPEIFEKLVTDKERQKKLKETEKTLLEAATQRIKEENEQLGLLVRKTLPESYTDTYLAEP